MPLVEEGWREEWGSRGTRCCSGSGEVTFGAHDSTSSLASVKMRVSGSFLLSECPVTSQRSHEELVFMDISESEHPFLSHWKSD